MIFSNSEHYYEYWNDRYVTNEPMRIVVRPVLIRILGRRRRRHNTTTPPLDFR